MSTPAPVLVHQADQSTPLGATIVPNGVTLRTWAPSAKQVFVLSGNSLARAGQSGFCPAAKDPGSTNSNAGFAAGSSFPTWTATWMNGTYTCN